MSRRDSGNVEAGTHDRECRGGFTAVVRSVGTRIRRATRGRGLTEEAVRTDNLFRYRTVLAAVETAWLFTKGSQSVRLVRGTALKGEIHLHIHGPGPHRESHAFRDMMDCMQFQAEYERRLVAKGFALERLTSDRRLVERREHGGGKTA
jgi:hypothetical protein